MWRMTDGVRRKVWFEWSAEAYLSASTVLFATSPSPPSESFPGSTLSPRPNTPLELRNRHISGASLPSPMVDAFASAPSPRLGRDRDSGRMQGMDSEYGEDRKPVRIKIGASKLHNPSGRTSWIGF